MKSPSSVYVGWFPGGGISNGTGGRGVKINIGAHAGDRSTALRSVSGSATAPSGDLAGTDASTSLSEGVCK